MNGGFESKNNKYFEIQCSEGLIYARNNTNNKIFTNFLLKKFDYTHFKTNYIRCTI
jgi:hypothetical protein